LTQSYRYPGGRNDGIVLEFTDTRRFKAGSWQSGPTIAIAHEAQVLTQVEQFLTDHPGDYVRLLSIDPKAKQRQVEQIFKCRSEFQILRHRAA